MLAVCYLIEEGSHMATNRSTGPERPLMKRPRWVPRLLHLLLSLVVAAGVLYVAAFGAGALLPPLGPALNVGTGIWTSASTAKPVQSETLHFPNLHAPVTVIFEANGTPHIMASTDDDLFRSEEHTSELQSRRDLVCRLLLEKKK